MPLIVLVGGARSGKSAAAVRLAAEAGAPVTFIATGEAGDDEMAARIASHRAGRPRDWTTIDAPIEVVDALAAVPGAQTAIVDCLTLWVSNLLGAGQDDDAVISRARAVTAAALARPGATIVVTNEVGAGLVPMERRSRRYRDLLGTVNALVAAPAHHAYLLVAGRALALHTLGGAP